MATADRRAAHRALTQHEGEVDEGVAGYSSRFEFGSHPAAVGGHLASVLPGNSVNVLDGGKVPGRPELEQIVLPPGSGSDCRGGSRHVSPWVPR